VNGVPASVIGPTFYALPMALAFAVIAVAILRRQPRHPIGVLYGFLAVTTGYSFAINVIATWRPPGTVWALWVWSLLNAPTSFALALALLLFPTGRANSPGQRWLARLLWGYAALGVVVSAVAPWPDRLGFSDVPVQTYLGWPANPLGWPGRAWLADAGALVAPVGVLAMVLSAASLIPRWRRSTGDERQQLKWLGLAGLLFATEAVFGLTQLVTGNMPENDPAAEFVGQAIFLLTLATIPVAVALGVVRYRLYDIDTIITRALVYGGLAVFISAAYGLVVVGLGELIGVWTGSSIVLTLAAAAALATALHPVRRWLHAGADRLVFGERAAPYALMSRFGHALGRTLSGEDVLTEIAQAATRAARADAARVVMPPTGAEAAVAVRHGDETIAEIAIDGRDARRADVALLHRIAAISAPALHNLRLTADLASLHETILRQNADLAASRARLVAAAEEARTRLAGAVAERIGPDLEALRAELPGPADLDRHLARATRIVEEVRALSRGVLPRILVDLGLPAALRAMLRRIDVDATLDVAASMGRERLPAAVETTVYLCCHAAVEAATAGAPGAVMGLRLRREEEALVFEIVTDAPPPGEGELAVLRDRVDALGGRLTLERAGLYGRIPVTARATLAR
jgi:two-component system, NarL family, sensor kinase